MHQIQKDLSCSFLKTIIEAGCPVSEFSGPLEVRLALAAAMGGCTMKLQHEEAMNGVFSIVMEYLCQASDEEILAFQKIKVEHASKKGKYQWRSSN